MIVLEVAIGLVLIYFLYSLLSSIIAEMISSWIGMRARMLRQGLDNFLNDKIIGSTGDFKKWLQDVFLVEPKSFKYTTAGKFYEEPTIKYLAKPGEHAWYSLRNRKPAYVSAENFVITVLNMLSNKGRGISEWDKIKFAIETNALHLDPETLKMFQDMVKRADDSYENFVNLIQNHFADTMERVNGWYKRKIGLIIFYIGLVMAIAFNVDTIQIVNTLSNDPEKRLEMVGLAEDVIEKKSDIDNLLSRKDTIDDLKYKTEAQGIVKYAALKANSIIGLGWDFPYDSTNLDTTKFVILIKEIDSLKSNLSILNLSLDTINERDLKNTLQKIADLNAYLNSRYNLLSDSIGRKNRVIAVNVSKNKPKQVNVHYEKSGFSKTLFVIGQFLPFWELKFWGILITALALTLGSQFWFDLLKKLVALRSAGVKPEENEEKKKQLEKLKLSGDTITSKDPVEIAISQNRGYWESLPGFIAYNVILEEDGSRYIEVTLNEETIKSTPKDDSKLVFIDPTKSEEVQIKFKLAKLAEFQQLTLQQSEFKPLKGHLYIENTNSYGTPTGLVKNRRTNQIAILTCGHVARPIKHSGYLINNDIAVKLCEDQEGKKFNHVGIVSNIVMSSYADGGLIDIQDHKVLEKFTKITHIEEVNHKHLGKKFFVRNLKQEKKEAYLIDYSRFYSFDDGGIGNARFLNLLMFEPVQANDYMSLPGDSGTLVYSENNVPVAIIIGGSAEVKKTKTIKFSYAIRLTDLKEILQFDLFT